MVRDVGTVCFLKNLFISTKPRAISVKPAALAAVKLSYFFLFRTEINLVSVLQVVLEQPTTFALFLLPLHHCETL